MVVYSKYPIDQMGIRTFQHFLWRDMPGALLPDDPSTAAPADWFSPAELDVVRLSSKSHWDLPILVGNKVVHFLVSHPTPPVFDGPEDRNGTRNFDEIRFWADYITPSAAGYIYDDHGVEGGRAHRPLLLDPPLHRELVELLVGLGAGAVHCRALAAVEHTELDAGAIRHAAHQAVHDALTGVANRPALLAALFNEVERANRYERPLSVAFVDIEASGSEVLFALDNQPELWSFTHPAVHAAHATYAEVIARNVGVEITDGRVNGAERGAAGVPKPRRPPFVRFARQPQAVPQRFISSCRTPS